MENLNETMNYDVLTDVAENTAEEACKCKNVFGKFLLGGLIASAVAGATIFVVKKVKARKAKKEAEQSEEVIEVTDAE